jgi:hypothetical protein
MRAQHIIGALLVAAGIVWSIKFPKDGVPLRPDFVASVAIGIGLIVPGMVVFTLKRSRLLAASLCTLLLWSVLLNAFLASTVHDWTKAAIEQQQQALSHKR